MVSSGEKRLLQLVVVLMTSFLLAMIVVPRPAQAASSSRQSKAPVTVEKEGFFGGIRAGRVTIIDQTSYRKATYLMGPSAVIKFRGLTIEGRQVPIHSIIRLILVDGMVQEMILMQEAS